LSLIWRRAVVGCVVIVLSSVVLCPSSLTQYSITTSLVIVKKRQ